MAELRRRGEAKFGPHDTQMFFVREALEQASGTGTSAFTPVPLAATGDPRRRIWVEASAAMRWPSPGPGCGVTLF